jgi:hypothetical protein
MLPNSYLSSRESQWRANDCSGRDTGRRHCQQPVDCSGKAQRENNAVYRREVRQGVCLSGYQINTQDEKRKTDNSSCMQRINQRKMVEHGEGSPPLKKLMTRQTHTVHGTSN